MSMEDDDLEMLQLKKQKLLLQMQYAKALEAEKANQGIMTNPTAEAPQQPAYTGPILPGGTKETPVPLTTEKQRVTKLVTVYGPRIKAAAEKNNIDPNALGALLLSEANKNVDSTSVPIDPKTGKLLSSAKGLGQYTDATAVDRGIKNRFSATENIETAAKDMRDRLNKYGSYEAAMAGHHEGSGKIAEAFAEARKNNDTGFTKYLSKAAQLELPVFRSHYAALGGDTAQLKNPQAPMSTSAIAGPIVDQTTERYKTPGYNLLLTSDPNYEKKNAANQLWNNPEAQQNKVEEGVQAAFDEAPFGAKLAEGTQNFVLRNAPSVAKAFAGPMTEQERKDQLDFYDKHKTMLMSLAEHAPEAAASIALPEIAGALLPEAATATAIGGKLAPKAVKYVADLAGKVPGAAAVKVAKAATRLLPTAAKVGEAAGSGAGFGAASAGVHDAEALSQGEKIDPVSNVVEVLGSAVGNAGVSSIGGLLKKAGETQLLKSLGATLKDELGNAVPDAAYALKNKLVKGGNDVATYKGLRAKVSNLEGDIRKEGEATRYKNELKTPIALAQDPRQAQAMAVATRAMQQERAAAQSQAFNESQAQQVALQRLQDARAANSAINARQQIIKAATQKTEEMAQKAIEQKNMVNRALTDRDAFGAIGPLGDQTGAVKVPTWKELNTPIGSKSREQLAKEAALKANQERISAGGEKYTPVRQSENIPKSDLKLNKTVPFEAEVNKAKKAWDKPLREFGNSADNEEVSAKKDVADYWINKSKEKMSSEGRGDLTAEDARGVLKQMNKVLKESKAYQPDKKQTIFIDATKDLASRLSARLGEANPVIGNTLKEQGKVINLRENFKARAIKGQRAENSNYSPKATIGQVLGGGAVAGLLSDRENRTRNILLGALAAGPGLNKLAAARDILNGTKGSVLKYGLGRALSESGSATKAAQLLGLTKKGAAQALRDTYNNSGRK